MATNALQAVLGRPLCCERHCGRYGKHRNGAQRFRCALCGKTFTEAHQRLLGSMTVDEDKALLALQLLVEGNSIRSTERITGIDRNTIMRLLVLAGERCERLMTERIQNLPVEHLECDEIWGYVGCHQRHVTSDMEQPDLRGDQYTFIALEERTKMVMAWHLGKRDGINTERFIAKVRHATNADRMFDVSTDGFAPYERAIDGGLWDRANHAQIVKLFSHHVEQGRERYSPARFVAVAKDAVIGTPDLDRASTSHVERKNGSLRQWCKRLTRLTYAYSKKWEHLHAALALHFAYYDFCRVHRSLRVTPAMEAGVTDHVWSIKELVG
ncbi:MAG TPA: IS1 family transposase [Vicinamibacterales bacterium]|nr:IS1 family transposase [Vicinamibacterales bacterium]